MKLDRALYAEALADGRSEPYARKIATRCNYRVIQGFGVFWNHDSLEQAKRRARRNAATWGDANLAPTVHDMRTGKVVYRPETYYDRERAA